MKSMKLKCYFLIFISIAVWMFTGVVMSAPASPTTVAEIALYRGTDRQQILEEGARKEGTLTFYTSGILAQQVRPVVDAFQKKYPFIKVEIWRAEGAKLNARVLEEYRAGKYLFDVMETAWANFIVVRATGVLQSYYSPNLAFLREGASIEAPGGGILQAAMRMNYSGILAYNTDLITRKDVPKTYGEVVDPKWKGSKFCMPGSATGLRWMASVYDTYGMDMLKRIVAQEPAVHLVSARAVMDMVIGREYIFGLGLSHAHMFASRGKGAPIDYVFMDPCVVNMGGVALPKNSTHPYAAMLFIDYELSKEAAEINKVWGNIIPRTDYDLLPPGGGEPPKRLHSGPKSLEQFMELEKIWRDLFLKGRKMPEE